MFKELTTAQVKGASLKVNGKGKRARASVSTDLLCYISTLIIIIIFLLLYRVKIQSVLGIRVKPGL